MNRKPKIQGRILTVDTNSPYENRNFPSILNDIGMISKGQKERGEESSSPLGWLTNK
jgi:hypothetical protein